MLCRSKDGGSIMPVQVPYHHTTEQASRTNVIVDAAHGLFNIWYGTATVGLLSRLCCVVLSGSKHIPSWLPYGTMARYDECSLAQYVYKSNIHTPLWCCGIRHHNLDLCTYCTIGCTYDEGTMNMFYAKGLTVQPSVTVSQPIHFSIPDHYAGCCSFSSSYN